jgi:hypothetical protein
MNFEQLYSMSDAGLRGALHVSPRTVITDPYALIRREYIPTEPIIYEYHSGGEPRDLIGTTYAVPKLLSNRVFDLFQENQFTGWATYPIELYGKKKERITGYQGFSVSGRCGKIDNSLSKREWRGPAVPGGPRYKVWVGLYFDLNTWDGSDIFVPASSGLVTVTERVKTAIEKAKFKNISFKRLTEFERLVL